MKKLILFTLISVSSFAQTQKGMFQVGTNLLDLTKNDYSSGFTFSPYANYFIGKGLFVGTGFTYQTYKEDFGNSFNGGLIVPTIGYVFQNQQKMNLYLQGSAGIPFGDFYGSNFEGLFLGGGVMYWLNKNVTIEPSVSYGGFNNTLRFNLGFSVYLKPNKKRKLESI